MKNKDLGRPRVNNDLLDLAISMKLQGSTYKIIKEVTGISKSTINKYQRKQSIENYQHISYRYEISARLQPGVFSIILDENKTSAKGMLLQDIAGLMLYAKREIEKELEMSFSDYSFYYVDSARLHEFEWKNNRLVEVKNFEKAA